MPSARTRASVAPRASAETAWPARASRAAIRPPTAPRPTTAILIGMGRAEALRLHTNKSSRRLRRERASGKIARSFDFVSSPSSAYRSVSSVLHPADPDGSAATDAGAAAAAPERPADACRDPRRRARPGVAHRPRGPVDRRPRRSHGDEQVGRLRPLRLARGTADLGRPRVSRQVRGRGLPAGDARPARPAAAARAVRPLGAARLGRDRLGLHLHQRRGRVRRPAGPGARRPRDHGPDLAGRARPGDPAPRWTKAICVPTPTSSSCCSRSTA